MTLPLRPTDIDPWNKYNSEHAVILDAIDKTHQAFLEIETFQERVISHTEIDKMAFESEHNRALFHRDTARALMASHAAYAAEVPNPDEEPITDLNDFPDHLRGLIAAHEAYDKNTTEEMGSDTDNPVDLNDVDTLSNPIELDSVNDQMRKAHSRVSNLHERVETYAVDAEDGMIWTPWVDAENQLTKLERAVDMLDEAYERTWDIAPNPYP